MGLYLACSRAGARHPDIYPSDMVDGRKVFCMYIMLPSSLVQSLCCACAVTAFEILSVCVVAQRDVIMCPGDDTLRSSWSDW